VTKRMRSIRFYFEHELFERKNEYKKNERVNYSKHKSTEKREKSKSFREIVKLKLTAYRKRGATNRMIFKLENYKISSNSEYF